MAAPGGNRRPGWARRPDRFAAVVLGLDARAGHLAGPLHPAVPPPRQPHDSARQPRRERDGLLSCRDFDAWRATGAVAGQWLGAAYPLTGFQGAEFDNALLTGRRWGGRRRGIAPRPGRMAAGGAGGSNRWRVLTRLVAQADSQLHLGRFAPCLSQPLLPHVRWIRSCSSSTDRTLARILLPGRRTIITLSRSVPGPARARPPSPGCRRR